MSLAPDIDSHIGELPKHIAIIMDGNNRWAKAKGLIGGAGHKAGETALQTIVEHAAKRQIDVLTVFAFSSENWRRPEQEVGLLMRLFVHALDKRVAELHKNNLKIRFIGDRSRFDCGELWRTMGHSLCRAANGLKSSKGRIRPKPIIYRRISSTVSTTNTNE